MEKPFFGRNVLKNNSSLTKTLFKPIKGSIIALGLVPLIFILINIESMGHPEFYSGLLISARIGLVILFCNGVLSLLVPTFLMRTKQNLYYNLNQKITFRLAMGLSGMLMGFVLSNFIEKKYFDNSLGIQPIVIGMLIGGIIYLSFLLKSDYQKAEARNLKLRADFAESNLNVLKNQMQPHFLFNSLNSLSELIDSNQNHATLMTQKLSDLYREILQASKTPKINLSDELSLVSKYLELESLRFGSRLHFKIEEVPANATILVPSLIIQTLVENAIKHGVSQSLEGGWINISVKKENYGYRILVSNSNANSIESKSIISSGTGLSNARSRLDLLYGPQHDFSLKVGNKSTEASFWLSGV